jgi:hypothetical protein
MPQHRPVLERVWQAMAQDFRGSVIGVRDAKSHKFAHDNPLPPRQLTTVSLLFLVNGQSHSIGEPFRATVLLTDHVGGRHPLKVIMH